MRYAESWFFQLRSIFFIRGKGGVIQGVRPAAVKIRYRRRCDTTETYQYPDQFLLFIVLFLLCMGLVMVYSSSSILSIHKFNDSVFYVKKQAIRVIVGLVAMTCFAYFDYRRLAKISAPFCIFFTVLLVMVYVPGIGVEAGGAHRWIDLGVMIQPSEYFKVFYILFLATSFSQMHRHSHKFASLVLPHLLFLTFVSGLVLFQPDLSTALLIALIGCFMIFSLYTSRKVLLTVILIGLATVGYQIWKTPYRLQRVVAFLDPGGHKLDSGYQVIQSKISLGSGGLLGLGLGQSRQKYFYLPEEHTDFIFAVIGEEFGYLGSCVIIGGFLLFLWRGVRIALYRRDSLGKLLAFGITAFITFQVLLNLMVVAGLAPPTGLPLPFLSYGGSAMITNLIGVGILLNISRFCGGLR